MIDSAADLVVIGSYRPAVEIILAGIAVAADGTRSIGERNKRGACENFRGHRVEPGQRDDVARKWVADEARPSAGVGHPEGASRIEYLASAVGSSERVGPGGGGQ